MSAKTQRKSKTKVKRASVKRRRQFEKFCIIGPTAYNRVFLDSESDAVRHAEPMFGRNVSPDRNPKRLLVVKVVRVIERTQPEPPPLTVRAPQDYDFPPSVTVPTAVKISDFPQPHEADYRR